MPLTEATLGTEADGSRNYDYCIHCYKKGAFTNNFTMKKMAEFCAQYVGLYNEHTGQSLTREAYEALLLKYLPMLKRWRSSADDLPSADSPVER